MLTDQEEALYQELLAKRFGNSSRNTAANPPQNSTTPDGQEKRNPTNSPGSEETLPIIDLSGSGDQSIKTEKVLSQYEKILLTKKALKNAWQSMEADKVKPLISNDTTYLELAKTHAPFLLFIKEKLSCDGFLTFADAMQISTLIRDMFTPHNWKSGEKMSTRTTAAVTRDSWMDFLGAVCKSFLNPVKYRDSGPETDKIRSDLGTIIRTCFFGIGTSIRYSTKGKDGFTEVGEIEIPLPKRFEADLKRKFKYRTQTENKFMDRLHTHCHKAPFSSPATLTESPRKPFCPKNTTLDSCKGGKEWMERGRERKSVAEMLKMSVVVRQNGGFLEVAVTQLSPTKRQRLTERSSTNENSLGGPIVFASDDEDCGGEESNENRLSGSEDSASEQEEERSDAEAEDLFMASLKKKADKKRANNDKGGKKPTKLPVGYQYKNSVSAATKPPPAKRVTSTTEMFLDEDYPLPLSDL